MKDLISRSELLESIHNVIPKNADYLNPHLQARDFGLCEGLRVALHLVQIAPAVDAEPVRLRIDTVEVDTEKGWYRKLYYCPCGQLIRTESWDKKYCFGQGTVLKGNVMPKHCPDCGAKMDGEKDGN